MKGKTNVMRMLDAAKIEAERYLEKLEARPQNFAYPQ